MVVSSAKRTHLECLMDMGRSFVYIIKNNDPKTEPWRTRHVISRECELVFL